MGKIWAAVLQARGENIEIIEIYSLADLRGQGKGIDTLLSQDRSRRSVILRLPDGVSREKVGEAFGMLSQEERRRLYEIRTLGGRRVLPAVRT